MDALKADSKAVMMGYVRAGQMASLMVVKLAAALDSLMAVRTVHMWEFWKVDKMALKWDD